MPRRFERLIAVASTIAMTFTVAMWGQTVPPGAQPAAGSVATGLILGKVVDGATNRPVSGALVSISRSSGDVGPVMTPPGAQPVIPQALTGGDGVFVFRNLAKGEFAFRAQAPGYLPANGVDARRAGGSTQVVSLGEGERLNDVTIRLWRGGALSGQVTEDAGEPVEGVIVSLLGVDQTGGRRNLTSPRTAMTDDRGMYRFSGLVPGDYVSCALFNRHVVPIAAGAGLQAAQSSGPAGSREMDRSLSGSGAPNVIGSSGYRIGDHLLTTSSGTRNLDPAPGTDGQLRIYTSVCYPTAPSLQTASVVTVKSGEERVNISLPVRLVPARRILGTLLGPTGPMGYVGVHLLPAGADDTTNETAIEASSTLTDPFGSFGFVGVTPGSYTLRVSLQIFPGGPTMPVMVEGGTVFVQSGIPGGSGPLPTDPMLWARVPVIVADTDVTDMTVALQPASRLSGRVVFEGTRTPPAADQIARTQIMFDAFGGRVFDYFAAPRAKVETDAQFHTTGFVTGKYFVRAVAGAPGWTLKSVLSGGRDVSDEPLEIETRDIDDLVVTFTDRPSELTGLVRDESGAIAVSADVVIFPADRTRWSDGNLGPRRGKSARVSRAGAFSFIGLPHGDYIVVALDAGSSAAWQDSKRLEVLSRFGVHVTLADAEKHTQDLKIDRIH